MTFNCKDFIDKVDGPTFIFALLIQQYLHVPIIILNVNRNLDKSSALSPRLQNKVHERRRTGEKMKRSSPSLDPHRHRLASGNRQDTSYCGGRQIHRVKYHSVPVQGIESDVLTLINSPSINPI